MKTTKQLPVSIIQTKAQYPSLFPYSPSQKYPEYAFSDISSKKNYVYSAIRESFYRLGYDRKNYGKTTWNPLGSIIKPGMKVVIKPNFVLSKHPCGKDIYSVITHPSVIRAVSDYCLIALKGKGRLTIADAPQYNCNFEELLNTTKLDRVVDYLKEKTKSDIRLLDLRDYWATKKHFPSYTKKLPGDPLGKSVINLKSKSAFYGLKDKEFYGAVYDRNETKSHHSGNKQEYEISKTIISADVYISIPKLKVHKKVGVTLNLKNLVGICTNKNYLVHYTLGMPSEGGDQFPENLLTKRQKLIILFERKMYDTFLSGRTLIGEYIHRFIYGFLYLRIISKFGFAIPLKVREKDAGNWPGNDSAWRMVSDLTTLIKNVDEHGRFNGKSKRKTLSIIDGIVGGQNKGPLEPDPVKSGIIIAGEDLIATDLIGTRVMGFNPMKIKQYADNKQIMDIAKYISMIKIISNKTEYSALFKNKKKYLKYKPYPGWEKVIGI